MKKNTLTLKKSIPSPPAPTPLEESIVSKADRAEKYLTDSYLVWRNCLPLSLSIKETLMLNYMKKYSMNSIKLVMRMHVSKPQYLQNIIEMENRVNLQGEITHSITTKNKEHAVRKLKHVIKNQ